VLNTQLDRPVGTLSAYMEMCDYFNIPTAPEGGELKPRMVHPEIKKKKKKKKKAS